jgi:hypothetical protein
MMMMSSGKVNGFPLEEALDLHERRPRCCSPRGDRILARGEIGSPGKLGPQNTARRCFSAEGVYPRHCDWNTQATAAARCPLGAVMMHDLARLLGLVVRD